jgi:hypothetical protein
MKFSKHPFAETVIALLCRKLIKLAGAKLAEDHPAAGAKTFSNPRLNLLGPLNLATILPSVVLRARLSIRKVTIRMVVRLTVLCSANR